MTLCYTELEWPQVPEEMEQQLIKWSDTAEDTWPGKKMLGVTFFNHFEAPDYLVDWARKNLPITENHTVILQRFKDIDECPIHKDYMRNTSYNYLLVPSDAETCWYDDDKKLINKTKYKHRVWYHHQSKVFHNVININKYRLAIAIFDPVPPEIYIPQYQATMKAEFESLSPEMQAKVMAAINAHKKGPEGP
jgi:hypothetical protein